VKSDLKGQATERLLLLRLDLRERAQNHPIIMFAVVTTAAFVWALIPGEPTVPLFSAAGAPAKVIHQSSTTKTSRLPIVKVGGACKGQSWGGESAECLKMIARESGKPDLAVRLIVDAAPTNPDTPNIF
jgi:hypothetical protein